MSETQKFLDFISESEAEFVDFRFTDFLGQWHHMTFRSNHVREKEIEKGIMFDGSSIAGWKKIDDSDMILRPDTSTAVLDPFSSATTIIVSCDVYDPVTGQSYNRDPRSIGKKAEAYLKESKIGDTAYFGPEPEFFVFDEVRYDVAQGDTFFKIASEESSFSNALTFETKNTGHRPQDKGGYVPVQPIDSQHDIRSEMLTVMAEMGLDVLKHHHEVAPSQGECGYEYSTLVETADNLQIYKYVVRNVAHYHGKTATFMPKPIIEDNGSGMHVHQSIWSKGSPLFKGDEHAGLSELGLYYVGGLLKHAKALNAFTNPTTNSYKRLVPGYEAPVLLAYSARNRSASCRIPHDENPNARRVEARFPDATANGYLAFAAMLMAGLDGIKNKIHPGDPLNKNLYDLGPEALKEVPAMCSSLGEALDALDEDRAFLTAGNVFDNDMIDAYLKVKREEVALFNRTTHPLEFKLYYSS